MKPRITLGRWTQVFEPQFRAIMEAVQHRPYPVIHQDVLRTLDENKPDVAALLRKFHVDYIVMPESSVLPKEAVPLCSRQAGVQGFAMYSCKATAS